MRLNLSTPAARRYADDAKMIVVPAEPQPDSVDLGFGAIVENVPCPYRVGDVLELAEPWAVGEEYDSWPSCHLQPLPHGKSVKVYYEADCLDPWAHIWRNASGMPDWAIRWRPKIAAMTCKRPEWCIETPDGWDAIRRMGLMCPVQHRSDEPCAGYCKGLCEVFEEAWTAEHGSWEPERYVYLLGLER